MKIKVSNVNTPNWREVNVKSHVPAELEKLSEMARNIWWSWNYEATQLFRDLDPALWKEVGQNPVLFGHFRLPYKYFGLAALTLVMLFWGAMAYGYFIGRWHFQTTHMEYVHKDIPKEFDGFKIVHISDLHLGTFDDNPQKLEKVVANLI